MLNCFSLVEACKLDQKCLCLFTQECHARPYVVACNPFCNTMKYDLRGTKNIADASTNIMVDQDMR